MKLLHKKTLRHRSFTIAVHFCREATGCPWSARVATPHTVNLLSISVHRRTLKRALDHARQIIDRFIATGRWENDE